MTGRLLSPIWVDEFTAPLLMEMIESELEHLKICQDERRDAFDPKGWARIKLAIDGLHRVWSTLRSDTIARGEPSQEDIEDMDHTISRVSLEIPRSTANDAAWRAAKAALKEQREERRKRGKSPSL